MLFAVCLTLGLSLGLLALSLCGRWALHALEVHAVGAFVPVLAGLPDDPLLPRRLLAAYEQNRLLRFGPGHRVVVLDCGLSRDEKNDCVCALRDVDGVLFLPPSALTEYLVASCGKK